MADKPIVVTVPSLRGAEYGFETIDQARKIFPDCEPVRYQDNSPLEEPKKAALKKPAPAKKESADA